MRVSKQKSLTLPFSLHSVLPKQTPPFHVWLQKQHFSRKKDRTGSLFPPKARALQRAKNLNCVHIFQHTPIVFISLLCPKTREAFQPPCYASSYYMHTSTFSTAQEEGHLQGANACQA
eukprot:scaffold185686_cov21-Tisochrysis_lutea.AAC.1